SCVRSFTSDDEVAVLVDTDRETGVDGNGRTELLDDGGTGEGRARVEVEAPVDGGVDAAGGLVEEDGTGGLRRGGGAGHQRLGVEVWRLRRCEPGGAQVAPLRVLVGVTLEVVAVEGAVLGVEPRRDLLGELGGERTVPDRDTDL